MNWEIIGVLAEVIGAAAVVISLIYVAIQIRDNSNQNVASRGASITDEFNRMQEVLISSPEVVALFTKMKTLETLTPNEETLLEAVANRYLTHWFSVQSAYDRNVIDKQLFDTFCEDVVRYVSQYSLMHAKFEQVLSLYSVSRSMKIFDPIFSFEPRSK